jgi:hypothetical protein
MQENCVAMGILGRDQCSHEKRKTKETKERKVLLRLRHWLHTKNKNERLAKEKIF